MNLTCWMQTAHLLLTIGPFWMFWSPYYLSRQIPISLIRMASKILAMLGSSSATPCSSLSTSFQNIQILPYQSSFLSLHQPFFSCGFIMWTHCELELRCAPWGWLLTPQLSFLLLTVCFTIVSGSDGSDFHFSLLNVNLTNLTHNSSLLRYFCILFFVFQFIYYST